MIVSEEGGLLAVLLIRFWSFSIVMLPNSYVLRVAVIRDVRGISSALIMAMSWGHGGLTVGMLGGHPR